MSLPTERPNLPSVSELTSRLRADLTAALRERDKDTARVLRTVLAAIANAEAQPVGDSTPASTATSSHVAGAADGLHAAEVDRRELSEADVRAVVAAERDERLRAAEHLTESGAGDAAEALRLEAGLLERYLET